MMTEPSLDYPILSNSTAPSAHLLQSFSLESTPRTPGSTQERPKAKKPKRSRPRLRNFLCTYPGCGKAFSDNAHLQDHLFVHSGIKPLQCTDCDKRFARASSLKSHQRLHANKKKFECTRCSERFICQNTLEAHEKLHARPIPLEEVPNACNSASCQQLMLQNRQQQAQIESLQLKIGSFTSVIEEHQRLVSKTEEQQKTINQLEYELFAATGKSSESQLKRKRTAAARKKKATEVLAPPAVAPLRFLTGEKPYKCMVPGCEKRLSNFFQLTYHAKLHQNVDVAVVIGDQQPLPTGPKYCPVEGCEFNESGGKPMKTLQIVKRHWERQHQPDRPHVCPHCPAKTFKTRDNLTSHLRECHKLQKREIDKPIVV